MTNLPPPGTHQSIRALFDQARRGHPEVVASYDRFCARMAALIASGDIVSSDQALDLYFACACEEGDRAALGQFELRFIPTVRGAIAKVTSQADLIDEATQELRQRLFCGRAPRIALYSGRGPLWKWLRVTAIRTAHDVRRARGAPLANVDDVVDLLMQDDVQPELRFVRKQYGEMLRKALADSIETLTSQEKTLLRLQYVENQGIDRLSVLFQAHRATIARWLQEIRRKISADVRTRLGVHIPRLSDGEADSLWRALRSQVHFSFPRLVAPKLTEP